jgi:hypothetical protein
MKGPIGSFGAQVNVGFAMGLFNEDTFRDLHIIRRIRNKFAHKLATRDFDTIGIRDLRVNLKIPELIPISNTSISKFETPGDLNIMNLAKGFLAISSVSEVTSPRSRFIRSTELLSGLLHLLASLLSEKLRTPQF